MPKPITDLTGQRFHRLLVLRFDGKRNGKIYWWVRCDCPASKEFSVLATSLRSGNTKSCGCTRGEKSAERFRGAAHREAVAKRAFRDLTGQQFGRLRVISCAGKIGKNHNYSWNCECSCDGKMVVIIGAALTKGLTRSCGCLMRESSAKQAVRIAKQNITHGLSHLPEYNVWNKMVERCTNPDNKTYSRYGGRGIKVCDRWLESVENFYTDMGSRPSRKHSLDRIDVNGDYCPENCRWATMHTQLRNKTNNVVLEHNGEKKCLCDWAAAKGMKTKYLWSRLKRGWPVDLAIDTPKGVIPPELKERRSPADPLWRLKQAARGVVHRAVKQGILVPAAVCEHPGCEITEVQGHHWKGYEQEHMLDVRWYCAAHHGMHEKETDAAERRRLLDLTFQPGDRVQWIDRLLSDTTPKIGVVVAHIPAGVSSLDLDALQAKYDCGRLRLHQKTLQKEGGYIVAIPNRRPTWKPVLVNPSTWKIRRCLD